MYNPFDIVHFLHKKLYNRQFTLMKENSLFKVFNSNSDL